MKFFVNKLHRFVASALLVVSSVFASAQLEPPIKDVEIEREIILYGSATTDKVTETLIVDIQAGKKGRVKFSDSRSFPRDWQRAGITAVGKVTQNSSIEHDEESLSLEGTGSTNLGVTQTADHGYRVVNLHLISTVRIRFTLTTERFIYYYTGSYANGRINAGLARDFRAHSYTRLAYGHDLRGTNAFFPGGPFSDFDYTPVALPLTAGRYELVVKSSCAVDFLPRTRYMGNLTADWGINFHVF